MDLNTFEATRLQYLADFFKVFGDPTRLKILFALHEEELNVSEISEAIDLSQSAVSHQLRTLKQQRIVKFRRDGQMVRYSLDDQHVESIMNLGIEHINELFTPTHDTDNKD